jgi:peroxiredoxin
LEGIVDKEGFKLSAFAGLSPYLIEGSFLDNNRFEGRFVTARGTQVIKGVRNDKASMADPYSLTQMKKGYTSLDFKLKNLNGEDVSLSDARFKGKVVIVSILGSWCPNCLDEMSYLAPWYKENKSRGVEIVGLSFERKDDPEYVHKVLANLVKRYDATYDILFAGKLGDEASVLPAIDKLRSYPTTIFVDKKGRVRKIQTGFNGPATGLFYEEFKTDFNQLVDSLLAEK